MNSTPGTHPTRGIHPEPVFLLVVALLAVVGAGIASLTGAGKALAHPAVAQAQNSQHVTVIVLDMSGSMSGNDPTGIRCSAADAYIDLSGIGSYVGVIGLDNSDGSHGGPHNFQTAQVWAEPTEMATLAQRSGLENAIATKSHNCAPDGNTPTYDALNQALTMLQTATQNGHISGSVILLTDGVPAPDTDAQVAMIKSDLLPQFQKNNWPVDTIALGKAQNFAFLKDIANGAGGKFYDDDQGVVNNGGNPSPLNIAPFFVDIFAQRNHRTPGPDVEPTALTGGSTSREFQIGNYVDHLDVVAIKDEPGTTITLRAPNGEVIRPTTAGALTVSDRYHHYQIYSIDGPQKGYWTFTITGTGSFLMDSLVTSTLSASIVSPAANGPALPLGQNVTIKATLQDQGNQISGSGSGFTLNATMSYAGGLPFGVPIPSKTVVLSDSNSPGTYQGAVNFPQSAQPGSYDLHVTVHGATGVVISDDSRTVRLELFPQPCIGACGASPSPTVVEWDPATRLVYGLPIGITDWLSHWPLGGLPARTEAHLSGQVYLKGAVYPNAAVKVSATRKDASGKTVSTPATLVNNGQGRFQVILPYTGPGIYTLTFQTSGSFQDSHGEFGPTVLTVQPQVTSATIRQEAQDAGFSLFYLLLALFIGLLIRRAILPSPYGGLREAGSGEGFDEFARASRNPWNWLVHPNKIRSSEMGLKSGLVFIFRNGRIEAQGHGYLLNGDKLSGTPTVDGQRLQESGSRGRQYDVVGKAELTEDEDDVGGGKGNGYRNGYDDDEDEEGGRSSGRRPRLSLPWGHSNTRGGRDENDDAYGDGDGDGDGNDRPRFRARKPTRPKKGHDRYDDDDDDS